MRRAVSVIIEFPHPYYSFARFHVKRIQPDISLNVMIWVWNVEPLGSRLGCHQWCYCKVVETVESGAYLEQAGKYRWSLEQYRWCPDPSLLSKDCFLVTMRSASSFAMHSHHHNVLPHIEPSAASWSCIETSKTVSQKWTFICCQPKVFYHHNRKLIIRREIQNNYKSFRNTDFFFPSSWFYIQHHVWIVHTHLYFCAYLSRYHPISWQNGKEMQKPTVCIHRLHANGVLGTARLHSWLSRHAPSCGRLCSRFPFDVLQHSQLPLQCRFPKPWIQAAPVWDLLNLKK